MPSPTNPARRRTAGPLLRSGDTTDAVIEALREDNPGSELLIQDHGGYLRIEGEDGLLLRRETAERALGRPFRMQEIELLMAGYSGMIALTEESARWYFKKDARTPDGGETR
ncbi:MmoB/DmpM family protein [Thermopolyspora sp. NPDC052614]|uniref:MmoB/DmpM family protein n=1 Tax=Thermopolyspora sp. NPDC052614 TaxID=3155682 RepID=UPI0034122EA4